MGRDDCCEGFEERLIIILVRSRSIEQASGGLKDGRIDRGGECTSGGARVGPGGRDENGIRRRVYGSAVID